MAPILCPILTCQHPVPNTLPPTLQEDIIDHLRNTHKIKLPDPIPQQVRDSLRARQAQSWRTRWVNVNARIDDKLRQRRREWAAFVANPKIGVPQEVDCGEEHAMMAILADVLDDEVDQINMTTGLERPRSKQKKIQNDPEAKAKVGRLMRYLEGEPEQGNAERGVNAGQSGNAVDFGGSQSDAPVSASEQDSSEAKKSRQKSHRPWEL